MTLEINFWSEHLNQLIYSYYYYCKKNRLKFNLVCNKNIVYGGATLNFNNNTIFFDYSDNTIFMDLPNKYDFYLKRSLRKMDKKNNIHPLNFNLSLSYNSLNLLCELNSKLLMDKHSTVEIIRALDSLGLFFKGSHKIFDIKNYPNQVNDNGGKVIFKTRLWDPDNNPDQEEKERRIIQNEFRINTCRIIKRYFKNSAVGIAEGVLANKITPDLIICNKQSSKKFYLEQLNQFNIGIADDGLKDTPGWKIGEYALYGKAIITTPITVSLDNFTENKNYLALSDRNSYKEIPEKIELLLKNKKYLEIGKNNLDWSHEYIHPENYIERILHITQA